VLLRIPNTINQVSANQPRMDVDDPRDTLFTLGGQMEEAYRHTAELREKEAAKKEISLNALELIALEQYYLGEEDRRALELRALEERLTQRVTALEALEARLTQRLDAVHALEARLKYELGILGAERGPGGKKEQ